MTPLQKAAQELLELHLPTYLDTHVSQLRTALEAEQAQGVEPIGYVYSVSTNPGEKSAAIPSDIPNGTPLYAHPAPPPATGERAELIAKLRTYSDELEAMEEAGIQAQIDFAKAADMLEADGKAQQVTHYDQQALELCPECGWKAIMPGEPCFVCNMQTEAQQVAVPTGWALVPIEPTPAILDAMSSSGWKTACYKAMLAAAQGVKP